MLDALILLSRCEDFMLDPTSGNIQSALYSGLQGYKQGSENMNNASRELASGFGEGKRSVDVNQASVDLISGSLQAQASANVISRADGMLGTIIDTFA
jgi:hypothetical protein